MERRIMENRHGKRKIIPYFGEDIEGRSEIMIVRIVCIFSLLSSPVFADEREKFDENDFLQAVMTIKGTGSEEYLSEDELEYFRQLAVNPIAINGASSSELLATGLFSPYQAAVIEDYRSRSGDILSLSELALLDGFGDNYARAVSPFVTLVSNGLPGEPASYGIPAEHESVFRSALRYDDGDDKTSGMYGMKYRFSSAGRIVGAGLALRSPYGAAHWPPAERSFFVSLHRRKFDLVLGDFNAKFGQGLALWSGFSMSGTDSPASFAKNPVGIVPYGSYSGDGTFRGIAGNFRAGKFTLSAFVGGDGLRNMAESLSEENLDGNLSFRPGVNIAYYGWRGQTSLTFVSETDGLTGRFSVCKVSADGRYSIKGVDLFSEIAIDCLSLMPAGLVGSRFAVCDGVEAAVAARYYPPEYDASFSGAVRSGTKCTNEHGVTLALRHLSEKRVGLAGKTGFGSSVSLSDLSVNLDASFSPAPKYGTDTSSYQVKAVVSEVVRLSPMFGLRLKFSGRYRTYSYPFNLHLRAELEFGSGEWNSRLRADVTKCRGISCLGYLEGGRKSAVWSAYLRCGMFRVDYWDDRIYVYERDAPGNFSVPAYYGRGYWLAFSGGVRLFRGGKLYFRASFTDYPWRRPLQESEKPGRAELKLQFVLRL